MPVVVTSDGKLHGTVPDKKTGAALPALQKKEAGTTARLLSEEEWERVAAATSDAERQSLCQELGEAL